MEIFMFTLQIFCNNNTNFVLVHMASVVNGKIDFVVTNLVTCLTYLCEMDVLMNIFMAS
jgi:hypothetical protein